MDSVIRYLITAIPDIVVLEVGGVRAVNHRIVDRLGYGRHDFANSLHVLLAHEFIVAALEKVSRVVQVGCCVVRVKRGRVGFRGGGHATDATNHT